MAWTSPTARSTGDTITASIWNADLVNNLLYLFGLAKIATYAATLTNVQNTTTETTVLSFSIPAGAMGDGDVIEITVNCLAKNNKGSGGNWNTSIYVGAGAQVTYNAGSCVDSGTERTIRCVVTLQRRGSTVVVANGGPEKSAGTDWNASLATSGTSTPTNFTGANTVNLKWTLDAADATFYVKPQSAVVVHIKN